MSRHKDISIITAIDKNPAGLKKTIESLAPLLHSNISWEHIIVDSSEAEHAETLASLPKEKPWPLVHIPVPPTGTYSAMNHGWRRSQGKLLLFLNGGDRLKSSLTLEKAVKEFKNDPHLDLLLGTAEFTRDGKYLHSKTPHPSFIRNILGSNGIRHQAMLYKRSAFERVGEFSTRYKLASDYEHHFRCYLEGLKHKSMNLRLAEIDLGQRAGKENEFLAEYAKIQKSFAHRLSVPIVRLNDLLHQWETTRSSLGKKMTDSKISLKLQPLLRWGQRRNSSKNAK